MSGSTSGLPYGVFIRNGYTWFMTANEPLSYEPAGSSAVICSVVPMVSVPPAAVGAAAAARRATGEREGGHRVHRPRR